MKAKISFSKAGILALPLPTKNGQVHYKDPEMDHHYVRVTDGGVRSFVAKKNDQRRGLFSLKLGPAGTDELTAVNSRKRCVIALGLHQQGFTTDQIRLQLEQVDGEVIPSDAITMQDVMTRYLTERKHKLTERTRADYQKLLDTHFSDWKNRAMEAMTEDDVIARFTSIRSPSRANYAFRVLRLLYRYARSIRKDGEPVIKDNPVDVLSQRRIWHDKVTRRDVVKLAALKPWWKAVGALADREDEAVRDEDMKFAEGNPAWNSEPETTRDFLKFLVLTGLRRNEGAKLLWENVDFRSRLFTVPVTKNKDPHTLPLSDYLLSMLKRRAKERSEDPVRKPYVFSGASGPLGEPKKLIAKVVAESSVPFSCHTLRRTFATIAESQDIPYYALKRLMNHRVGDVTGGYTVIDVERLREPMQKVTDFILKAAGERRSAEVVKLEGRRARA